MIDRRGEITPNMRLQKLAQYDRLTTHCLALADAFIQTKQPKLNRTFVDADGDYVVVEVTPELLNVMARLRDRAFKDYLLPNPSSAA